MMDDPNFLQQINEAMDNPAFQQMLESSPQIRDNPLAREMLRNPAMRRMMFDPRMMRMNMEMQRAMGGGAGAGSAFPAPGVTDTTPQPAQQGAGNARAGTQNTGGANPAASPLAALLGNPPAGGNQANPFASLFGVPPTAGSPPSAPGTNPSTTSPASPGTDPNQNQQNQFANLGALMELMQALGPPPGQGVEGGTAPAAAGANPFAGLFGMQPPAPVDNRPPEERYAEQLRQLNDMGFYEFERNIEALRRSGGSVQGAVEYLLSGGGS
jgi:ubiquilin